MRSLAIPECSTAYRPYLPNPGARFRLLTGGRADAWFATHAGILQRHCPGTWRLHRDSCAVGANEKRWGQPDGPLGRYSSIAAAVLRSRVTLLATDLGSVENSFGEPTRRRCPVSLSAR